MFKFKKIDIIGNKVSKEIDKDHYSSRKNNLTESLKILNNRKNYFEGIRANLNKLKIQTNIITLILFMILEIGMFGIGMSTFHNIKIALLSAAIVSPISFSFSMMFGNINGYKRHKKALQKYDSENIQEEIDEKNKELSFVKKQIKNVEIELSNLLIDETEIEKEIKLLESEINKIRNIRNNVITEYIKDNKELDILINNEYEQEQQKQLIMKNDSNK